MPLSLSERALAIAPSVTLAIDTQAKKIRAEGLDVIPCGAGEPDFCTPEYINEIRHRCGHYALYRRCGHDGSAHENLR